MRELSGSFALASVLAFVYFALKMLTCGCP